MLASRWWMISHNNKSRVHRVLKSRYFPNTDAKNAPNYVNSSYVWSSLMAGKRVVDMATYMRVGDGLSIDVVPDPWI